MTTSRITDEAVKAAERAMRGHDCHPVVNANIPHLARAALEAAEPLLGSRPMPTREELAAAAHKYYCVTPGEATHDPDEIDFDQADKILEILALLNGVDR
jgi:hypothetical protein